MLPPRCFSTMSNELQLQRRLDVVASSVMKSTAAPTQASIRSQQFFTEANSDRLKLGARHLTASSPIQAQQVSSRPSIKPATYASRRSHAYQSVAALRPCHAGIASAHCWQHYTSDKDVVSKPLLGRDRSPFGMWSWNHVDAGYWYPTDPGYS
ncbi:hypothetical protein J3458_022425 [Metarhizium acridum]|uniref:uncharacterized protein n=1 Tax=Metarhizium acridum TaxID=92637 RepID=UPI001C6C28B8|nr:hypothetical protein J3458_022425 [Metarhizium acridum]